VFCSATQLRKAFLKRMRKRTERKDLADKVLKSLVNVLSLVYAHVYFPCYSNGLKEVGGSWAVRGPTRCLGLQSLVWRARWEGTRIEDWNGSWSPTTWRIVRPCGG